MPSKRGIVSDTLGRAGGAFSSPVLAGAPPVLSPLQIAAFYLALIYVFLFASRLPEFVALPLRPMLVLGVILLIMALLCGRLLGILETRAGWLLVAFTGWMAFVIPFSRWRGGSVATFTGFLKSLLLLVVMTAFVTSITHSLRVAHTIGFAMGVVALMAYLIGTDTSSRLEVEIQEGGTLGDPNFFCLYILTGLPLLWLKAKHASRLGKILPLAWGLLILWSALRSASRSGLVSFLAGMLFLFWQAAPRHKVKLLTISAALGVILLLAAPKEVLQRLTTWFEIEEPQSPVLLQEESDLEAAVESARLRRHLLWQSILLTLEHPLVGVGPGMFMEAEAARAENEGRRGAWRHTHNMYTQISSETGLPGLALFLAFLISLYRSLTRIRKRAAVGLLPQQRLVYDLALYLQMALIIVLVDGLFLSIALGGPLYILAGSALGLESVVRREWGSSPPMPATIPPGSPA